MAAAPITKILLKNTTKMSLNERFTTYRQQGQSTVNSIRQKIQQQRQASLKNRRLAQQMANRPSVIAALKIKRKSLRQRLGQSPGGFSGGSSVKSRLSFGRQGNRNVRGRLGGGGQGRNRGRGVVAVRKGVRWSGFGDSSNNARSGTSPMLKARLGNQNAANKIGQTRNRGFRRGGRGFGRNYRQQRGSNFRGTQFSLLLIAGIEPNPSPLPRSPQQMSQTNMQRRGQGRLCKDNLKEKEKGNQLNDLISEDYYQIEEDLGKSSPVTSRTIKINECFETVSHKELQIQDESQYSLKSIYELIQDKFSQLQNELHGIRTEKQHRNVGGAGGRRKGRGGRQNRGRGRNWGQANVNKKNIPSKQELDNELDEYMAKTKSHLDADLDAYMAQADS
ncbi:chromatin target of PRMT1 protein [Centruroides vittatus]|uniref:chromatin target of PRMT1 protein n=1 Tax=Centruroides vittatus TaxID=120091 RepID=UPI00350FE532